MPRTNLKAAPVRENIVHIQDFLDMISPSVIKFNTDHFICGNTFRCVWALREYPTATDEQAILRYLGEKDGVTLSFFGRTGTPTNNHLTGMRDIRISTIKKYSRWSSAEKHSLPWFTS